MKYVDVASIFGLIHNIRVRSPRCKFAGRFLSHALCWLCRLTCLSHVFLEVTCFSYDLVEGCVGLVLLAGCPSLYVVYYMYMCFPLFPHVCDSKAIVVFYGQSCFGTAMSWNFNVRQSDRKGNCLIGCIAIRFRHFVYLSSICFFFFRNFVFITSTYINSSPGVSGLSC